MYSKDGADRKDGHNIERYCQHCGTVEVFLYSDSKKGYYCSSCGAILEEG